MRLILAFLCFLLPACSDITYSRPLEGKVVNLGSRFSSSGKSAQEKISVVVQPTGRVDSIIQDVAGGPSGVAVECVSTRCATMVVGSCHQFKCSFEWTTGADVIQCKHVREVQCQPVRGVPAPGTNGL